MSAPQPGDRVDLWVGVPVSVTKYEPSTSSAVETTHFKTINNQRVAQQRTCYRWDADQYHGPSFEDWKTQFFRRVNDYWDKRLELVHSSELSFSNAQRYPPPPLVRCRFKAWEAARREHALLTILVTAISDTDQQTSSCTILAPNGTTYRGGIAEGYRSLLDSNDVRERTRTATNGVSEPQIAVVHEMGHYIGLNHRCQSSDGGPGRFPHVDPDDGPTSDQPDPYCGTAEEEDLTRDVMAYGMNIARWHAYVWKGIWTNLGTTPDGFQVPRTGYVERVRSPSWPAS